ncbi:MAG: nuclear transport factor 2 family protein [Anaerolineae bacterium]|nr:nuclear transport factor 2 family protein [Anaerolineae bacterium]
METVAEHSEQLLPDPLSAELVLDLWSRTYNKEGKPDWSHIFPYYHDEIIFQDTIQRIEGIDEFKQMCARLTKRCEQLNMDIDSIAQNGSLIFFTWKMTMIFRKFPSTPIYGSTRLTLNEGGMIIEQRDFYDLWGDIFNGIPRFKKMYRRFMKKYFG